MLICVDLDGTLFDTVSVNAASYQAALNELGYTLTVDYFAAHCNGRHYKEFLPALMGGSPDSADLERVHDRKKALYRSYLPSARRNEALFALLDRLRDRCDLAVVTTGSRQNALEILDAFGCRDWFGLVVTSEDVTRSKPDPEGYRKAMAHFGADAAHTVIFEDSPTGLAAARASGAAVFQVDKF